MHYKICRKDFVIYDYFVAETGIIILSKMIELSVRIKKDDNCPEALLKSIVDCIEQTLIYSYNHQVNKMEQMNKLRILTATLQKNMDREVKDFRVYCWLTEVGFNSYFVWIVYSNNSEIQTGRLYLRLQVQNKMTSLVESCIEVVGPHMRDMSQEEIRELNLPNGLVNQLEEYRRKDVQFYHEVADLKLYPYNRTWRCQKGEMDEKCQEKENDLMIVIWNKLKTFFSTVWSLFAW